MQPAQTKKYNRNLLFRFFQTRVPVEIWLYENTDIKIEGRILGFDEYLNMVLDDACEVTTKGRLRRPLGRILLKGDNVTLRFTRLRDGVEEFADLKMK